MALKTVVKVGNITNLSDARYCAGMGVDLLGFTVTEGSENYIPSALYQQIRGWVSGPQFVIELYRYDAVADLKTLCDDFVPDFIETDYAGFLAMKGQTTLPFIVSLSSHEINHVAQNNPRISYWVIDESSVEDVTQSTLPVLVKVSSKDAASRSLLNSSVKGLVLTGSKEIRPGFKVYDDLSEVLEALEED